MCNIINILNSVETYDNVIHHESILKVGDLNLPVLEQSYAARSILQLPSPRQIADPATVAVSFGDPRHQIRS